MTTLFISDLHLDESRPKITAAFYDFLKDRASKADALYILGDFFEAWIGDDEDSSLSREVVGALKQLSDSGVQLFVMHGNRDFLLGSLFCQQSGATLLPDPSVVNIYGKKILLMHGDSLCTGDSEYMAFRLQARSKAWQEHLLSHSLEKRREIVAYMRSQSKNMNSLKSDDIMDVCHTDVISEIDQAGVNTLIHGHTHRPGKHTLNTDKTSAMRWVLGDWGEKAWFIEAKANTEGTLLKLTNYTI
jgi:UDP-2,3-diacylglucosamine hydrolase